MFLNTSNSDFVENAKELNDQDIEADPEEPPDENIEGETEPIINELQTHTTTYKPDHLELLFIVGLKTQMNHQ